MDLLIFFNGRSDSIIQAAGLDETKIIAVKADEKILSSPAKVKAIVSEYNCEKLYFGCIDLELQRFHVFMFLYFFLLRIKYGAIIDEKGNKKSSGTARLFFSEIPLVALEAAANAFIVAFYYVKIFLLRNKYMKYDR